MLQLEHSSFDLWSWLTRPRAKSDRPCLEWIRCHIPGFLLDSADTLRVYGASDAIRPCLADAGAGEALADTRVIVLFFGRGLHQLVVDARGDIVILTNFTAGELDFQGF